MSYFCKQGFRSVIRLFFQCLIKCSHRLVALDLYKSTFMALLGLLALSSEVWAFSKVSSISSPEPQSLLTGWAVCALLVRIKGQLQKVKGSKRILRQSQWQPSQAVSIVGVDAALLPLTASVGSWGLSLWRSFWVEELAFGWFYLWWIISQRVALCHYLL